ncbi:unnamed protein product, partial [Prorocentrum cordatum]
EHSSALCSVVVILLLLFIAIIIAVSLLARVALGTPALLDKMSETISAFKNAAFKKAGTLNLNDVKEWVVEERRSQASCRSLPFTFLLYCSFTWHLFSHRQVDLVFPLLNQLGTATRKGIVPLSMPEKVPPATPSELSTVSSWADAMVWLDRTMVPLIWSSGSGGAGAVMGVNRLVGGMRLRQTRLKHVDCPGPDTLANSYDAWFRDTYNQSCVSDGSELATGPLPEASAGSLTQGTAPDSNGWYTYWMDANLEQQQAFAIVDQLRAAEWLSTETELLRVQAMMYNGQVAMFVLLQVDLTMDRVGAITKTMKTQALPAEVFDSEWAYVADFLFVCTLAWLFLGEALACIRSGRQGALGTFLFKLERLTNITVLVMGAGFVLSFVILSQRLAKISDSVAASISSSEDAGTSMEDVRLNLDESYDLASTMTEQMRYHEFAAFAYTCLMLVRFFDGFRGNQRLAILTDTLAVASDDLFHFLCIFAVVFSNFVISAHLLFGQSLLEWSDLRRSSNTGFRALMGDFDFESMYRIAPVSATIWFWSFMLLIFLTLINIFLAIVLEAYTEVKEKAGSQCESLLSMFGRAASSAASRLTGLELHAAALLPVRMSGSSAAPTTKHEAADLREEIAAFRLEMRACLQHLEDLGGPLGRASAPSPELTAASLAPLKGRPPPAAPASPSPPRPAAGGSRLPGSPARRLSSSSRPRRTSRDLQQQAARPVRTRAYDRAARAQQ